MYCSIVAGREGLVAIVVFALGLTCGYCHHQATSTFWSCRRVASLHCFSSIPVILCLAFLLPPRFFHLFSLTVSLHKWNLRFFLCSWNDKYKMAASVCKEYLSFDVLAFSKIQRDLQLSGRLHSPATRS